LMQETTLFTISQIVVSYANIKVITMSIESLF
jgi:hypothetical protein